MPTSVARPASQWLAFCFLTTLLIPGPVLAQLPVVPVHYEVSGAPEAEGFYLQQPGLHNERPFYKVDGQERYLYYCSGGCDFQDLDSQLTGWYIGTALSGPTTSIFTVQNAAGGTNVVPVEGQYVGFQASAAAFAKAIPTETPNYTVLSDDLPSANGVYHLQGFHNNRPYYIKENSDFYLYFCPSECPFSSTPPDNFAPRWIIGTRLNGPTVSVNTILFASGNSELEDGPPLPFDVDYSLGALFFSPAGNNSAYVEAFPGDERAPDYVATSTFGSFGTVGFNSVDGVYFSDRLFHVSTDGNQTLLYYCGDFFCPDDAYQDRWIIATETDEVLFAQPSTAMYAVTPDGSYVGQDAFDGHTAALGIAEPILASSYQVISTEDANGFYEEAGTFNGLPYFKASGQELYLYFCTACDSGFPADAWLIGTALDETTFGYFKPVFDPATPPEAFFINAQADNPVTDDPTAYVVVNMLDTPLPVELTAFEVIADASTALLTWTTASETNNAGFEVEMRISEFGMATESHTFQNPKSKIHNAKWQSVGWAEGHGTTTTPHTYTHRIAGLQPGVHRFRLKQVDFDGRSAYSPEIELVLEQPGAHRLSPAYPNPFRAQTRFSLRAARAQTVTVSVYDAIGRRVGVLFEGPLEAGRSQALHWNADSQPDGLYLIRAAGEHFVETRSVLLVR